MADVGDDIFWWRKACVDTNIKTIWPSSKIDVTNISVGHSEWLNPQKCQGGSKLLLLIWYWWLQVISNVGDKIKTLLTSSWCWHPILISIDQRCRWPKGSEILTKNCLQQFFSQIFVTNIDVAILVQTTCRVLKVDLVDYII